MPPRRAAALLVAALALGPATARAQDAESALSEQLFLQGRQLMQQHDYARACPKLEEAYRLDTTATGTLLNLALCHEALGRTATAWTEFRTVAAQSRGRREDRVRVAEEHEKPLADKLSFLTVMVPAASRLDGLEVKLDGHALGAPAWGTALPVDPGARVVEATAPGHDAWRADVSVGGAGDQQRVTVPPLAASPRAPAAPRAPSAALAPLSPVPDRAADGARARRTTGWVLGGTGLAAAGVGAVFGALAIARNGDVAKRCPNDVCASGLDLEASNRDLSSARSSAVLANVLIGLGVAALTGGAVLVLLNAPRGEAR